eukprot:6944570-Pyramimonas_sp.AAC.1
MPKSSTRYFCKTTRKLPQCPFSPAGPTSSIPLPNSSSSSMPKSSTRYICRTTGKLPHSSFWSGRATGRRR